ncbi:MAG: hypothetical protein HZB79_01165 [Deltaproteobacteria bacterium]|nr:hypothetical protein [Deltaproteobacteria bacterium]
MPVNIFFLYLANIFFLKAFRLSSGYGLNIILKITTPTKEKNAVMLKSLNFILMPSLLTLNKNNKSIE